VERPVVMRRMRSSGRSILGVVAALGLGACPSDPTFVASDDVAPTTETVVSEEVAGDAETIEDAVADAEATDVVVDVIDGDDAIEVAEVADDGETGEVHAGCFEDCGPGAACQGVCVCVSEDCSGGVRVVSGVQAVAVASRSARPDAAPAPIVAWVDPIAAEVRVARWAEGVWKDLGRAGPGAAQVDLAIAWPEEPGPVVASPDAEGALHLMWRVGDAWQDDTTALVCLGHDVQVDPSTGRAVVGCRFDGAGAVGFVDVVPGQTDFTERPWEPLAIGKQNRYAWAFRPSGEIVAARTKPRGDARLDIEVQRSHAGVWEREVLMDVVAVSGLEVVVADDGRARVIVAYEDEDAGDVVIVQQREVDALTWSATEVRRRSYIGTFASALAVTPLADGAVGVAWNEGLSAAWREVAGAALGTPASLTRAVVALGASGRGARTPVVIVVDESGIDSWLPRGP